MIGKDNVFLPTDQTSMGGFPSRVWYQSVKERVRKVSVLYRTVYVCG